MARWLAKIAYLMLLDADEDQIFYATGRSSSKKSGYYTGKDAV